MLIDLREKINKRLEKLVKRVGGKEYKLVNWVIGNRNGKKRATKIEMVEP